MYSEGDISISKLLMPQILRIGAPLLLPTISFQYWISLLLFLSNTFNGIYKLSFRGHHAYEHLNYQNLTFNFLGHTDGHRDRQSHI